jgi:hypothetical protein
MTATFFIGSTATMIAPHRIAEIQIAGIGGRTNDGTTNGADCGACCNTAGRRADKRARTRADQGTGRRAVTRIGAATGQNQHRSRRGNDGKIFQAHICLHNSLGLCG